METYAPLFASIVESSLWKQPLHVRVLFVTMLPRKDWDHVVRVSDHHLKNMANITDDQTMDGLRILSSPDTSTTIPQPFDGRRIERVEEGWLILNGDKYQRMMKQLNQRAMGAKRKREQRERDLVKNTKARSRPLRSVVVPVDSNGADGIL